MGTYRRWDGVAETLAQARHLGLFVEMLQAMASALAVLTHRATATLLLAICVGDCGNAWVTDSLLGLALYPELHHIYGLDQ